MDSTFKYHTVMIDKAKQEIAAVNVLASKGLARRWLLCYFHFLQEWERFIVSKESSVNGRPSQQLVVSMLADLAQLKDRAVFEVEVSDSAAGQRAARQGSRREGSTAAGQQRRGCREARPSPAAGCHSNRLHLDTTRSPGLPPPCSPCAAGRLLRQHAPAGLEGGGGPHDQVLEGAGGALGVVGAAGRAGHGGQHQQRSGAVSGAAGLPAAGAHRVAQRHGAGAEAAMR